MQHLWLNDGYAKIGIFIKRKDHPVFSFVHKVLILAFINLYMDFIEGSNLTHIAAKSPSTVKFLSFFKINQR